MLSVITVFASDNRMAVHERTDSEKDELVVKVGGDNAKGVCRLSTGADAFITYLLNPFIWGD